MKCLLGINALFAWEHVGSLHHESFAIWAKTTGVRDLNT